MYKNKSFLRLNAPLKNISGQRLDYCNFRVEIELIFEHKTFKATTNKDFNGYPLTRMSDDEIRGQYVQKYGQEKSNEYNLTFVFEKHSLDLEIFKHKPKKVLFSMWSTVSNSVGYSNHETKKSGDLIYDKIEINGW